MQLLTAKVLAIVTTLFAGLAGGLSPIFFRRHANHTHTQLWFSLADMYAGGVFLALGLIHLLPEAEAGMTSYFSTHGHAPPFSVAHTVAAFSVILLLVIEECVLPNHEHGGASSSGAHGGHRKGSGADAFPGTPTKRFAATTPLLEAPIVPVTAPVDTCASHGPSSCGPDSASKKRPQSPPTGPRRASTEHCACEMRIARDDHHNGPGSEVHDVIVHALVQRSSLRWEDLHGCTVRCCRELPDHERDELVAAASPRDPAKREGMDSWGEHPAGGHAPVEAGLKGYLMFLALSMHSIFAGVSVGTQDSVAGAVELWIALAGHKWLESLSLASSLVEQGLNNASCARLIAFFSLVTPAGIALGLALTRALSGDTLVIVSALASSVAAGAFIFVSLLEITAPHLALKEKRRLKLILFAAGCATLLGLQCAFGHSHEEGDHDHDHDHDH